MTVKYYQKLLNLSDLYRRLPHFRGKYRLGRLLFKKAISQKLTKPIKGQRRITYNIMNTHDSVGRDIFFDGIYEPETIRFIEKLLKPGNVFVDAGANIGAISIPIAISNEVKVFAFEPGPNIFAALKQNVQANKLGNFHVFQKALSDKTGSTDFYESDRVHGWSGLVKINSFQHVRVDTITLDEFCKEQQIPEIHVLKMDVQGWEFHVLKGAMELLNHDRIRNIIFEFEWWAEENAGLKIGAAQELLLEKGYMLKYLNGKKLESPQRTDTVQLWASR